MKDQPTADSNPAPKRGLFPIRGEAPPVSGLFAGGIVLLGFALSLTLVAVEILTVFLVLLLLFRLFHGHKPQITRWDLPFITFILIRLLSSIFGDHAELAAKGFSNLFFAAAYFITAWSLQENRHVGWRNFIRALVIGTAIASVVGLIQVLGGEHRAVGLYGGYTVFGSLTGASLILGIFLSINNNLFKRKLIDIPLLTLCATGLAASICRAEWIAAILVLLPAGIMFRPKISALVFVFIAVLFLAITPLRDRLFTMADPVSNLSGREVLWQPALELITEKPVLGHGLNSFQAIFPDELRPYMTDPGAGDWHNLYLQVAVESGLLGLVAFLWMLGIGLYICHNRIRLAKTPEERGLAWGLFGALAFFCIAGGMGVFLVRIPITVLVFLVLGGITSSRNITGVKSTS
ncbi:hypothetical protein CEE37_12635 [candidate division LCP-89 bacterium B3_LCP]|uniref:O-antigen ligase-related domain-containing protein n=1 Tax=candidate division LCP-89 bacterium B3_LCP TaxID=2012998 RepID=A0A532UTU3_UNCL8|nr:MAG: hypothetical protein CEE37_12635 [candidate division LCP-89 bacterium B3_LCP]